MPTFDTLHREGHKRGNIRKAIRTIGFLGRRADVDPPETLFSEDVDGKIQVADLIAAGFSYVGMVTSDGFNFENDDSMSETTSQGFPSPTREDIENATQSVTFTFQEIQKRTNLEFINGARYDDVEFDGVELVRRSPAMPEHEEWCLVVVAIDGPEDNEYLDAKVLPTIKNQTRGGEQWGGDAERSREVTARVYVDDELGVPAIEISGGKAFARTAEDLGWNIAPEAP